MTNRVYGVNHAIHANSTKRIQKGVERQTFQNIYQQQISHQLKLSHHAQKRLEQRNLKLDSQDLNRINEALEKASTKGANESLVIYKDLMLIASVQNRTIITAMEQGENEEAEEIFTNIDSAVVIK